MERTGKNGRNDYSDEEAKQENRELRHSRQESEERAVTQCFRHSEDIDEPVRAWKPGKGDAREGAEGQNRTVDTGIFSAVLYQLSYLGRVHNNVSHSYRTVKKTSKTAGAIAHYRRDRNEFQYSRGWGGSRACFTFNLAHPRPRLGFGPR